MPTEFLLARYNIRVAQAHHGLLDEDDLARVTGLHPDMVRRLYSLGALEAEEEWQGRPLFAPAMLARLRRMLRLRRDLGLSWHGLGMVAELLERIDRLEARVRQLETTLASPEGTL
ncbi:MAG TPA: chaperone modulator CbpM [Chthonomonadaceae bacterium]|nr:chaperone modulator CbpM [Chthonomonadaceae bacterium]